jgi:hypothetical protein
LLALARSVKFEDIHVLTREEIARFGLDRRDFVETPWRFEGSGPGMIRKFALARASGETSFRVLQWRVTCLDANRFTLDFQRPVSANASLSSVSIADADSVPLYFAYPPVKAISVEQWSLRMQRAALKSLLERSQIELVETAVAADGRRAPQAIKLSNAGSAGAFAGLVAACMPAKYPAAAQTTRSDESVAK